MPALARAESLHVVFPQMSEVTVVQGQSSEFTLEVQAFGATNCDATTAPVLINTLYSVDAVGDVAQGDPSDMPIETDRTRGASDNCYIKTPVVVPLTATAAEDTPVGKYLSVIRYGHGGDGDIDTDGPQLTIHVIAPDQQPEEPQPPVTPPVANVVTPQPEPLAPSVIVVLGERIAPKPVLGKSVELTGVKGTIRYRLRGKAAQVLAGTVIVPNGTVVDATEGVVKVTVVRDSTGARDSVDVWDGAFRVVQSLPRGLKPLTTLTLTDGITISRHSVRSAHASVATKKRSLWANGKGNFKTQGKKASAIVRGTYWHTEETPQGTKVSVSRGLVAVQDFVRHRTVLVTRGHSYTAPNHLPLIRRPVFTGSV